MDGPEGICGEVQLQQRAREPRLRVRAPGTLPSSIDVAPQHRGQVHTSAEAVPIGDHSGSGWRITQEPLGM